MTRGGYHGGHKPKGSKYSDKTEIFYKRVTPEEKKLLNDYLEKLREENRFNN